MVGQASRAAAIARRDGDLRRVRLVLYRRAGRRAAARRTARAAGRRLDPRSRQHCPPLFPCRRSSRAGGDVGDRSAARHSHRRLVRRGSGDAQSTRCDRGYHPRLARACRLVDGGDRQHRAHSRAVNRRRIRVAHNGGKHLGHTSSVGISGGRDARHLPQRRVRWPRWASFPALCRRDADSVDSSESATRRARRVDGSCWRGRIVRQAWRALSRCDCRRGGSGLRMAIHGTIGTMADGCHRRGRGARRPRRVLASAGPSRRR